ncbi:ABC transporter permease subunit [Natronosporangium hydrolyticum]|nr:ABC transporter permease subunit [Natronosporangium hydrolyticum]
MARESLAGPVTPAPPGGGRRRRRGGGDLSRVEAPVTATGLAAKALLLGVVAALAIWAAFPLIEARSWIGLSILAVTTVGIFYLYLSRRHIPAKYLLPGTLFLIAFQLFPVLYTASTAFTNFGDGHRGSQDEAIVSIQTASVRQVPGSAEYALSIATTGDPASGQLSFLVRDPATGEVFAGDQDGLSPLPADQVSVGLDGRITEAPGYTVLNAGQASARSHEITNLAVPTDQGAILASGLSRAYEGRAQRAYEAACDCVVDTDTGQRWYADQERGSFVSEDGDRLVPGWRVNVGFDNFTRVLTDPRVSGPFLETLVWNFAFAFGSVAFSFALGVFFALALQHERLRGRALYRVLLVLPYAMPAFAMLLVWRDMFNTDFGLINRLFGWSVDWMGGEWTARGSLLLVNTWLGYPYMFLITTGALQSIPKELTEAARIDGAGPWHAFRRVTLPLLMVALTPLLIASFAFNFNNFNAVYLVSGGGPFPPDSPLAGATDLLITYTYRLAFGGAGAQYGFAAAISVYIFLIVAVVSAIAFRRTRAQEEVWR